LLLVFFGGNYGLGNDIAELIAFVAQFAQPMLSEHFRLND
jgi:hypothetical protein